MHRRIAKGFHWIQELGPERPGIARTVQERAAPPDASWCPPGRRVYIPQNAFILEGERTLMLDTLSPDASDSVLGGIEAALGDRPLDYLVISHPDVPHAGNTALILRRYPDVTLVAPRYGDLHELYRLDGAMKVGEGDSIDLGGRVVRFHEATFLDAPMHLWMSDEQTQTLFCVDWMGFPILDGEALKMLDEIVQPDVTDAVLIDRYYEFHARVMFWFQYVDVDKVAADMDHVRETFRPSLIAPAHGPLVGAVLGGGATSSIVGPARAFEVNKKAMAKVRETGRVGVL